MKKLFIFIAVLICFAGVLSAANASQYYDLGMKLYSEQNYDQAMKYFVQAGKMDKKNPEYFRMIGKCLEAKGDLEKSTKYYAVADKLETARGGFAGKKIRLSPFAGYTSVNMTRFNEQMKKYYSLYTSSNPFMKISKQDMTGGFIAGADLGFAVMQNLFVGPKIEVIAPGDAKVTSEYTFEDYDWYTMTTYSVSQKVTINSSMSMIPILGGATYDMKIQGAPITISGNLHLGMGLASGKMRYDLEQSSSLFPAQKNTFEVPIGGSCFVAELGLSGIYQINEIFGAGLNLGYRLANVGTMTVSSDTNSGLKAGDVIEDDSGSPMPFDFGGFIAGAKITVSF